MTATHIEAPKIQAKKYENKGMGVLTDCVRKKRDRTVLTELLKVNV